LLAQPTLLAMDEPLASLDAPRKAEILPFLARLKTALKLPILYVTHSTEELASLSLADTLVLLETGRVVAAGPLEQIITRSDIPLAVRDDSGSVLTASVIEHDQKHQLTTLRVGPVTFSVSLLDSEPGTQVRIRVPAREVILAAHEPGPTSVHNVIAGSVRAIAEVEGKHAGIVEVAIADNVSLLARITLDAIDRLGLVVGRNVTALVKSLSVEILSS
jgi:molybdate transport system ATP-binding protein